MRKPSYLLTVLVVSVLGCAESADDTPSARAPSQDTETENPATDPGSSGELLTITKSGGLAGTTETLTIGSDGRAELEGDAVPPQRLEVPPELLNRLEEELQNLDWTRAAAEPDNAVCSDCFEYDIRAGGQRVTTTGMGQSGEELRDLLALIDEIISSGSSR